MQKSRMSIVSLVALSSLVLLVLSFILRSSSPLQVFSGACIAPPSQPKLNVFVAHLPPELNYELLHQYWDFERSKSTDTQSTPYFNVRVSTGTVSTKSMQIPPYPEDPLIKQYSAEYWLLGDLMTPEDEKSNSVARRVWNSSLADVIFVPFFATLSAELQLHKAKGKFRYRKENADYDRQVRVMEIVKSSPEWQRSGGRDHIFVLTDPVAMWHVRSEIAPAVLLTVDFGGWYMEDAKEAESHVGSFDVIRHRQVSLLKDVIVPYTHLLPPLHLSDDRERNTLLYFKGARHRHRTGLVRDKLWAILKDESGVVFEEGFPNKTGKEQALKGMRDSEFCLHPAGDTPTSCRLFDAVFSLCIPVIVSDSIELPFEGVLDYTEFSLFVAVHNALQPKFLIDYLKSISFRHRKLMRTRLASVQHFFEYDNGYPSGIGPIKRGAVNEIWRKVSSKVPAIKEAITRDKRKPSNISVPARCQCL